MASEEAAKAAAAAAEAAEKEADAAREAEIAAREAEIAAMEADLAAQKAELAAQQEEAAKQKEAARQKQAEEQAELEQQAAQEEALLEAEPVEQVAAPRFVSVRVPAETVIVVEMNQSLSSHTSQAGQAFWATVTQDVAIGGRVAVPRGTMVAGRVTEAHAAEKIGGRAKLALRFDRLDLPGGESVPITATFAEAGKSQKAKDAGMIAGGVVGGAILGEAVDEGG